MLHRIFVLALVLSLAGFSARARADDVVECDQSREACDAKILELCPAGAEVLDEQELSGPRYRMTFRCRGTVEGTQPVVPAPVPVVPGAPVEAGPSNDALRLELQSVDARLADLKAERSRHSLVGPIVLTSIGFGAAFVGALMAIGGASDGSTADSDFDDDFDDDFDNDLDSTSDEVDESLVIAGSVIAVVGAGVGTGGLIWLVRRLKARKANQPEIDALKARQQQLRTQGVNYSFAVDPASGQLLLRGRF